MTSFLGFGEVAGMFRDMDNSLAAAERQLITKVARDGKQMAKDTFGHAQPGWEPLETSWTMRTHEEHAGDIAAAGFAGIDTPLVVTGSLRDSVKSTRGDTWAEIGTNDVRMPVHELGAPNPLPGHEDIPARPVFGPLAKKIHDSLPKEVTNAYRVVLGTPSGETVIK